MKITKDLIGKRIILYGQSVERIVLSTIDEGDRVFMWITGDAGPCTVSDLFGFTIVEEPKKPSERIAEIAATFYESTPDRFAAMHHAICSFLDEQAAKAASK